ncbi:Low temperature viability protein-domain-containing protein [Mycena amicta]|nr:Low temperature viability protein-domain-containing protein [Mycena amicta]
MAPTKSKFRGPGTQHFQLVHRSQRDPLFHDPDASKQVLKPIARNGKSRADLEDIVPASDRTASTGEASLYGIYYDDSDYDYMQHLRTVGVQEEGVESVLIEAPSTRKGKGKEKEQEISLLPEGVLASKSELPRNYESQQAIPTSIAGFQPDMDPHLRQVLEALEDDAFVEDELEDDFFGELVADGQRGSDEEVDFDFSEQGAAENGESEELDETGGWEERFSQFKKTHLNRMSKSDDGFEDSEGGDTVGRLPEMSVIGGKGKRRRKGTSDASGYSMSSSSMYRNDALQTLDERFDQMILKEYDEESSPDEQEDEDDNDEAPELITSRDDFESMMDEFLNDYEILGRKMKPKLEGDSGAAKLDTLRRAMGQDERVRIEGGDDEVVDILMPLDIDDRNDRWDCETILTTYSNLENHPRLIRGRDGEVRKKLQPVPKIHLDPRTGMPLVVPDSKKKTDSDSESSDDDNESQHVGTIKRDRNESKEAKKARKQAVKEERLARRAEKKATKEMFGAELKTQKKALGNKERRLKSL